MMKKCMQRTLALVMAGILAAGCGSKKEEDAPERLSGSAVEVQYKGVEYEPYDTEVTAEEIQTRIDSFLQSHPVYEDVTDRDDVREGDTVNIDYTGYMDGEAFPNGSDKGYDLTIGSGQFIPGFESGLVGAKVGTTVDVEATFPDPYKNNPDFSGKTAVFSVTVNGIKIKLETELTDELVAANTDYATVADYREYIESSLRSQKESYAENYKKNQVMGNLIEMTEFTGIAQEDIDSYYESSRAYYSDLAKVYESTYGYSFSMFILYFFGCSSEEEYDQLLREQAELEVKRTLILYYVIDKENIAVTQDEYNEAVERYAKEYNLTSEEFLAQVEEEKIQLLVKQERAEQFIYDNAVSKTGE
ncbi:MAG: trigger factor [Lachnospiraceae bacterium]|nr:trigger factor [Lachnospiraceae bacterium]